MQKCLSPVSIQYIYFNIKHRLLYIYISLDFFLTAGKAMEINEKKKQQG